jgi:hypothetical protein
MHAESVHIKDQDQARGVRELLEACSTGFSDMKMIICACHVFVFV